MAEAIDIPAASGSCSVTHNLLDDNNRKNGAVRVQIVPSQPKTLSHLPTRPPVDLAFHNLTYRVKEGRRNSKYIDSHAARIRAKRLKLPSTAFFARFFVA